MSPFGRLWAIGGLGSAQNTLGCASQCTQSRSSPALPHWQYKKNWLHLINQSITSELPSNYWLEVWLITSVTHMSSKYKTLNMNLRALAWRCRAEEHSICVACEKYCPYHGYIAGIAPSHILTIWKCECYVEMAPPHCFWMIPISVGWWRCERGNHVRKESLEGTKGESVTSKEARVEMKKTEWKGAQTANGWGWEYKGASL